MAKQATGHREHPKSDPQVNGVALAGIGLVGFKRFTKLPPIELAPLTVITGENSSGKSSILQSLVLLKQSIEERFLRGQLAFNGHVRLGSFDRVLSIGRQRDRGFEIELMLSLARVTKSVDKEFGEPFPLVSVTFQIGTASLGKDLPEIAIVRRLTLALARQDYSRVPLATFALSDRKGANPLYKINWHNSRLGKIVSRSFESAPFRIVSPLRCKFEGCLPTTLSVKARPKAKRVSVGSETAELPDRESQVEMPIGFASPLLGFVVDTLKTTLGRDFFYIGPLRVEPDDLYSESSRFIGVRGENALAFLKANRHVTAHGGMPDGKCDELLNCVNSWLKRLGIGPGLCFAPMGSLHFEATLSGRYLTEVGCGVSQILPVLVQCLAARQGALVLLEQPEIHLHQKLQAGMADFFIAQMRRGLRMLIETHSEILIHRIRRRIAEDRVGEIQANTRVYFIGTGNNEVQEISIDRSGNVTPWPDSFFDQAITEMQAVAKAQAASREVSP